MTSLLLIAAALAPVAATPLPADPLQSPMWEFIADQVFGDNAVVRFDPRVKVSFPEIAENQRVFPVQVDARAIPDVVRVVIIADLNPIQLPIDFRPAAAEAFVATRIKLDQRTPVRGAVQLKDGSWLVSGGWIDAAGGGCSAPPVSRVKGDWAQHLGEVRGRLWTGADGARLRLAFRHPMDTGLVDKISAYYIDDLKLRTADGRALGEVKMQAAVAEDPVLTLMPKVRAGDTVVFAGRDTNGIDYAGSVAAIADTTGQ
ncbi:quinoprotein dehydrogenase-associated SoxYZ-like carrier [Sphingomonas donggukensis]|uniref:Quinoprotein dehydrogenase-associated SoxYZ-like carrier n=1 Tax=Sphingomonas donggukensis TaxID=2949093 RepID=A0ABY4TVA7_9SPHN|nr:quinoprotein dehydrogenase-associated SoxYZ-like carrier [Sphingomonas donggukensis]URW76334.1 quinoprotein dehydrogenase-associated SoxYZ-like carrier [Sphingomonas donggukensis]